MKQYQSLLRQTRSELVAFNRLERQRQQRIRAAERAQETSNSSNNDNCNVKIAAVAAAPSAVAESSSHHAPAAIPVVAADPPATDSDKIYFNIKKDERKPLATVVDSIHEALREANVPVGNDKKFMKLKETSTVFNVSSQMYKILKDKRTKFHNVVAYKLLQRQPGGSYSDGRRYIMNIGMSDTPIAMNIKQNTK